jgi:hypothetical protein
VPVILPEEQMKACTIRPRVNSPRNHDRAA